MQKQLNKFQQYKTNLMKWQHQMEEARATEANQMKAFHATMAETAKRQQQATSSSFANQNFNSFLGPSNSFNPSDQSNDLFQNVLRGQKAYKLEANTPIFTGTKKHKIDDWLFGVNNKFEFNKISDHLKLNTVVNFLSGVPHRMVKEAINESIPWTQFEARIRKRFEPIDYREELLKKLTELKQNGNLDDYVTKFYDITEQMNDISDRDKMTYFKKGLIGSIANEVTQRQPQSLEEAINIATRFDKILKAETTNRLR